MRSLRGDGGAAVLEFVLLLPVLLILMAAMMTMGRLWMVRADVLAVARQAAREAVTQPDAASAAARADRSGRARPTGSWAPTRWT